MICTFFIDTIHLTSPYDEGFWNELPVELTDEQFDRLYRTMVDLIKSKEFYSLKPQTEDDEWWLHKYLPDIHQMIEDKLKEWAPKKWDEGILPQLFNVDMYAPQEAWDKYNLEKENNERT